jgi:large subunit ribosomal protein L33
MGDRVRVALACGECGSRNYQASRSQKARTDPSEKGFRLEVKKHCKHCNKHTVHKESK